MSNDINDLNKDSTKSHSSQDDSKMAEKPNSSIDLTKSKDTLLVG